MLVVVGLALVCTAVAVAVTFAAVRYMAASLDKLMVLQRDERDAWRRERAAIMAELAAERTRHREETAELLNRIMHPRVYQPTPEQERTIRQASPPEPDDFEKAGTVLPFAGTDGGEPSVEELERKIVAGEPV